MIDRGLRNLAQSAHGETLSAYHLQAEIAAVHCSAEHFTQTKWEQILALYDLLAERQPTPVVLINRAVAVAQVHGPAAGLEALKVIEFDGQTDRYPFLAAAEGEFFRRLGRFEEASRALEHALECARTEPERRFIQRKLASLHQ
jgi:RNA polymerase sigma-70 factor (ECF subfamily)